MTTKSLLAFTVLAIAAAFSACGGDDNPDPCDETQEECAPPDDGEDADPTPTEEPDADVPAPDAGPAATPCAGYEWLSDTVWNCGGPENCFNTIAAITEEGLCVSSCTNAWNGVDVRMMVFSEDHMSMTYPFTCDRLL